MNLSERLNNLEQRARYLDDPDPVMAERIDWMDGTLCQIRRSDLPSGYDALDDDQREKVRDITLHRLGASWSPHGIIEDEDCHIAAQIFANKKFPRITSPLDIEITLADEARINSLIPDPIFGPAARGEEARQQLEAIAANKPWYGATF